MKEHSYQPFWRSLLLLLLTLFLVGCGGTTTTSSTNATPKTGPAQPDTGPKGLPLRCPNRIIIDQADNLYLLDNDSNPAHTRVMQLSTDGKLVKEWHVILPSGKVLVAAALAVDVFGNLFLADNENYKIHKISASGKILASWGTHGTEAGQFEHIRELAVDTQQHVYVIDEEKTDIMKFSDTGKLLGVLKLPLNKKDPEPPHPLSIAIDNQDGVLVIGKTDVALFSADGEWVNGSEWQQQATTPPFELWAVTTDRQGNRYLIVSDTRGGHPTLEKIDPSGKTLAKLPLSHQAIGVAIDSQNTIYVLEVSGASITAVEKLTPTGQSLARWQVQCDL